MAEEKKNYRNYSPNANYGAAVFGSEAYEPEWILPEQPEELPSQQPQPSPEPRKKARRKKAPKHRTRTGLRVEESEDATAGSQGLPVVTILLTGLLFVAVFLILMANIRLMTIRSETRVIQRSIAQLQQQADRLDVAYAAAFDLNQVRTYAENELGMREPTREQIHELDLGNGDRAMVLTPEQSLSQKAVLRLADMWQSLLAYFR